MLYTQSLLPLWSNRVYKGEQRWLADATSSFLGIVRMENTMRKYRIFGKVLTAFGFLLNFINPDP
ncbi:hypothetical protein A2392_00685 [Candidatus Kaiserbacteria bacterium RIFOXYB1_FULL_46_14]|uniref:Uncharacterized protein n=1 Tax=Candidatus Kaiserbacteria bacterium RIFOXYB1_FULL_46_14 TaxID=1798531 RepID=A0A1F6FJ71_9BACT|nr:MAG: hypothetical protein A2392_00685 [Candidatus Kaiserbacteria bacterium RIFOXYB1_FULL_46_14]